MEVSKIKSLCKHYGIGNYEIYSDGSIDVNGDVDLSRKTFHHIPLNFHRVTGDFLCHGNSISSLIGSPKYVGGSFLCHRNEITSLKGGPELVNGRFSCTANYLTSLEFSPIEVHGDFACASNRITNLEGCTQLIRGSMDAGHNPLTSLKGFPVDLFGQLLCDIDKLETLDYIPYTELIPESIYSIPEKVKRMFFEKNLTNPDIIHTNQYNNEWLESYRKWSIDKILE